MEGRKRYEYDKCGRKSFWKRSKTAPFSFENGLVWTGPYRSIKHEMVSSKKTHYNLAWKNISQLKYIIFRILATTFPRLYWNFRHFRSRLIHLYVPWSTVILSVNLTSKKYVLTTSCGWVLGSILSVTYGISRNFSVSVGNCLWLWNSPI